MFGDDLEAIVFRGLHDLNQCAIDHFSNGPAVIGRFTFCKIDSSEWHDKSPLRCRIVDGGSGLPAKLTGRWRRDRGFPEAEVGEPVLALRSRNKGDRLSSSLMPINLQNE